MNRDVSVFECKNVDDVRNSIQKALQDRVDLLPISRDSLILLKPNLNSDMNALTGNTTDLRVIVSVVSFLKRKGYRNIVIGDGTSSGFYRNSMNVISRLKLDKIAKKFEVRTLDLNHAPYKEVDFGGEFKAKVAEICFDCDFFINLPKLKMHFEAQISACLKNLIGCVRGLDKQKVHDDLIKNILRLNAKIRPDLHIVDGLIAMEGTGPSAGTPTYLGSIVVGLDPYLVDMICAKLVGLKYYDVPCLKLAEQMGIITDEHVQRANAVQTHLKKELLRPEKSWLVALAYHPKLRKYFTSIRLSPLFDPIFSADLASKIFLSLGLRQDVFTEEEDKIKEIYVDQEICDRCMICGDFCPMNLNLPDMIGFEEHDCVQCLYCFFTCPKKAIKVKGNLGFISEQIRKYDKITRKMVKSVYRENHFAKRANQQN